MNIGQSSLLCGLALLVAAGGSAAELLLTPMEQLGKSIFFDDNLSIHANQSCAACHGPEVGDLGLTAEEEAAIVAFLKTLSDGYMP